MNRRIVVKLLIIVLILSSFISIFCIKSNASFESINPDTILNGAQDKSNAADSMLKTIQAALTIVQVVAVGISVIMLIVLAMKYMAASPGEKADIKKSATVYVVGAVILFATAGILQIIKMFSTKNINEE